MSFDENLQTVQLRSAQLGSGPERDGFTFDRVFPMGTKQEEVFNYGVKEYVLYCAVERLLLLIRATVS